MTYYGLTLNMNNLAGNIYLNCSLAIIVECIGYTSIVITASPKIGRCLTLSLSYIFSGIFLLASAPLEKGRLWVSF